MYCSLLLIGIESFSRVSADGSHFPNLLQKSLSGQYVQSFDELYEVVSVAQPCLEAILHQMKQALVQDILEVRRPACTVL